MKRRTKIVLLVAGLIVAAGASTVGALTVALAKVLDPYDYCTTGFSRLVSCNLHWSSRTVTQREPMFPTTTLSTPLKLGESVSDKTAWAIAQCPQNAIARRLLCAVASGATPVEAASDDLASGLPRPKPWLLTTGQNSRFIEAVHVETPLDLGATLRFYRAELGKRGWTENDGAVVEADKAVLAFTTKDGPAQLRLSRQDDRTIADLSKRKPDAQPAATDILPMPGQMRLRLGNDTDEAAVITINGHTVQLAANAGQRLTDDVLTGGKSPDGQEVNLPPGQYRVTLKTASGAAKSRQFEFAAGETWGLVVGSDGIPLPVQLY